MKRILSSLEADFRNSRQQTMYSTREHRKSKEKDKSHHKDVSLKKKKRNWKTKDAPFSYDSKSESNENIKIDFNEELHPIGYYVKDRTEMINQMFKVIQGKKLKAMLPPLLKGYSIDELKSLCLEELLGISEKRVMSVLEGRELETSSESEVHSSELEAEENFAEEDGKESWCNDAEMSSTTKIGDNDGDMDTLEIGITREEMGELLNDISCGETSQKKQPREKRCEKPLKPKKDETSDRLKSKQSMPDEHTSKETFTQEEEMEEDGTDKEDKSKGKTLLEILELEMRARAIRALLKQQIEESAEAITPYMYQEKPNVDSKNTDLREKCPEDINPQPRKRFKRTSENAQKKNTNTIILNATDDKGEMDLISTKIEVVDLTKEKVDAREVKPVACSESGNKSPTTSQMLRDNRAAVDKAKRRCYRSNQEEGQISSDDDDDDDDDDDTPHTVKIESQSDFDVITLDDSNDSICSLPRAERHVTIEKSNASKLTSVANQRLYSEILRSNLKVYVKNKGKLKPRDTTVPSFSKTQKGSEENRSEGKKQGIEGSEDAASDMTWAARWLKSKGVQKVVKTSKVCAKMRKRMKSAQQRSQGTLQHTREESKSPVHIIGSVKEYRMLDKPKANR